MMPHAKPAISTRANISGTFFVNAVAMKQMPMTTSEMVTVRRLVTLATLSNNTPERMVATTRKLKINVASDAEPMPSSTT